MQNFSPAADRNKEPIFSVLNRYLDRDAIVLEVASGTGQHAAFISRAREDITWYPTDPDPQSVLSIESYRESEGHPNFQKARVYDIREPLPAGLSASFDAIVNINMIHISPWEACLSLFQRANTHLKEGGVLYLYGPFFREGYDTAPSNITFDLSLRERDERWGIRSLEQVLEEAAKQDLKFIEIVEMPANNLSVLFRKRTHGH